MNPSFNNIFGDSEPMCQRGYNTFNHTLIFDGEILDIKEVINSLKILIEYFKINKLALFMYKIL